MAQNVLLPARNFLQAKVTELQQVTRQPPVCAACVCPRAVCAYAWGMTCDALTYAPNPRPLQLKALDQQLRMQQQQQQQQQQLEEQPLEELSLSMMRQVLVQQQQQQQNETHHRFQLQQQQQQHSQPLSQQWQQLLDTSVSSSAVRDVFPAVINSLERAAAINSSTPPHMVAASPLEVFSPPSGGLAAGGGQTLRVTSPLSPVSVSPKLYAPMRAVALASSLLPSSLPPHTLFAPSAHHPAVVGEKQEQGSLGAAFAVSSTWMQRGGLQQAANDSGRVEAVKSESASRGR